MWAGYDVGLQRAGNLVSAAGAKASREVGWRQARVYGATSEPVSMSLVDAVLVRPL